MRIQDIDIDRLAGRNRVAIHNLTPQLNVVYAGHAAAVSGIHAFVRWFLRGRSQDVPLPLSGDELAALGGSLAVVHNGRRRVLFRGANGRVDDRPTAAGTVAWGEPHAPTVQVSSLDHGVGDHGVEDHGVEDHGVECPPWLTAGGGAASELERLLDVARSHHLDTPVTPLPVPRLPELRLKADECRRALDRLPYRGHDLGGLLDRQRVLQQRLELLESNLRTRRSELDAHVLDLARQIEHLERRIDKLRTDRRSLQEVIDQRSLGI
ncbi:MAG TPA: hypothetical protein VIY86_05580, partial [Pirellulaceae bacterium]